MAYTVTITEVGSEISVNESSYPVTVSYNAIELEGIGEAPLDGKQYARKNAEWQVVVGDGTGGGGGIEEAPADGKTYGRKDETWAEVEAVDAGIEEAPADGQQYARQDETWTEVESIEEAPEDGRQYARKDRQWSEFEAGESTVANGCIHLNNKVLVDDYTIPTDKNGFSAGPIDFQGTVTVPTGSAYYVVDEELTPVSYTITEVDTLMLDKQDNGVSYTKTETDSLLENAVDSTDVYTKAETDSLVDNKVDVSAVSDLTTRLTASENDIIELEEEIEALAPSFDRGHWLHDPITGAAATAPGSGAYYLVDDNATVTQLFEDTHKIYFNNTDSEEPAQTHTFDDVTEGMYVELFEGLDSSFLLGVVDTVTKNSGYTVVDVTVVKAEGGPGQEDTTVSGASVREGIRVKFFNLSEGDINLDGYMQTSGGTFTGTVAYYGDTTHSKNLVTKGYVDSKVTPTKELHTLHSAGNSIYWENSMGAPNNNRFTTVSSLTSSNKEWHFNNLYNETGASALAKNYKATGATVLEIYYNGALLVKTPIRDWKTSTRGSNCMMCKAGGYKVTTSVSEYLADNKPYQLILTNMEKI